MSDARVDMDDRLYEYLDSVSAREAPALAALRAEAERDPRRNMAVSPMQGQFMGVLVRALGARKIVEVGMYTGYSSLAMALALPEDGHLWTFDVSEEWTAIARRHWERAGVAHKVELRLGPGAHSMDALIAEGHAGAMDLVFIDADKLNYPAYWERGLTLLRPGGLMIADNTLFQGIVHPDNDDDALRAFWAQRTEHVQAELIESTHAVRAFNAQVHRDERVDLSMVPVGDGMTFAVKR